MISWLAHSRPTSKPGGWWIERETAGWSLILMAREKPPANAPYPRLMSCLPSFADWMTCVLLATGAANAERWSGRGQRCRRRTVLSGWARLGTAGMGAIGKNCVRDSRPLADI